MPTSQKVQIDTYDFGASLTAPTLGALSTGTTITDGTASTCNEQTADSGVYVADFVGADASHLIPAGTYRLRTSVNGKPLKRFVTFAGVDGELVYARSERAVELDSATQTQLNNIENIAAQRAFGIIERPPADTGVITFAWPALGATITGTVSLNNASYIPVTGAFAFLRTDGGKYFYTLAYNAADRPATAGSARYALTDGTYTRYLVLRVVESGDTGETTALAVLCFDWEAITGEVPSRSVLNALRHIRNKWALDGATKTVYAEDDTTPAYTTTVTADGAGNITADTPD